MNQVIITPESSKLSSPNVTEASASVLVPSEQEGDKESVGLYSSRETERKPGEMLPENSHSGVRGIVLAKTLTPAFCGVYMGSVKLSAEEAGLLEGLN